MLWGPKGSKNLMLTWRKDSGEDDNWKRRIGVDSSRLKTYKHGHFKVIMLQTNRIFTTLSVFSNLFSLLFSSLAMAIVICQLAMPDTHQSLI